MNSGQLDVSRDRVRGGHVQGSATRWIDDEGRPTPFVTDCEFEHPHPDHPCGRKA